MSILIYFFSYCLPCSLLKQIDFRVSVYFVFSQMACIQNVNPRTVTYLHLFNSLHHQQPYTTF